MRKLIKLVLFFGIVLVIVGAVLLGVAVKSKAFTKDDKIIYNEYEITEEFSNFDIDVTTADIYFIKSEDNKVKVECSDREKRKCNVLVEDNTLKITEENNTKWIERFFEISFKSIKVKMYLPSKVYNDVKVKITTGDVKISNFRCNSLDIKATTGDIKLVDTIATGNIKVNLTTGDIDFEKIDANELYFKATTGDISGDILTAKTFKVKTTTGDKKYPDTTGNVCEIKTTTGDVSVTISK